MDMDTLHYVLNELKKWLVGFACAGVFAALCNWLMTL